MVQALQPSNLIVPLMKQFMADDVDTRDHTEITMSSLGHCARQLAYRKHGKLGEPLTWRAIGIFEDGDYHHYQIRKTMSDALQYRDKEGKIIGAHCFQLVDQEVEVELCGIKGHLDGVLKHDSTSCKDPLHTDMVLEVKSMNERSYKEAVKNQELSWPYACQVSAYLAAKGLTSALIVLKNKNTSEIAEFIFQMDPELVVSRVSMVDKINKSSRPEDIDREFMPKKSGALPWQCNYCEFVFDCYQPYGIERVKDKKHRVDIAKWYVDFPPTKGKEGV